MSKRWSLRTKLAQAHEIPNAVPKNLAGWSLKRRITLAYTLYALGFVLFFTCIAVLSVEGIETHLVDRRLRETANWALPRFRAGLPVEMPAGVSFHHDDSIPRSLRSLSIGVHDVDVDGRGMHVLSFRDGSNEFVVIDHQSDYDKVELAVYVLFGLGFLGFIAFSYLLAGYVVRGVVVPIEKLAHAVVDGEVAPSFDGPPEVLEVARAFARREDALRSALQRERFFTGDVSHEFRTNLMVILGSAELLSALHPSGPSSAPSLRILRAAKAASDSLGVLLQLARAPSLAQADSVDIAQLTATEVQEARHLVEHKSVDLRFDGGPSFNVQAPRQLCAAAISHLLRNACDLTQHGTVSVRLEHRSVIIEDTGVGLPEAVKLALRGEATPESGGSAGTGLGHAIVQRICEYLHCSLIVSDRPPGGTAYMLNFSDP